MKGSKIFAVSCALAAYAAAQDLSWDPSMGGKISISNGDGGYWYTFTDANENNGNSTAIPAPPSENPQTDWIGEHIANQCGGDYLCVTLSLGNAIDYPFAAVAFNYLDPKGLFKVNPTTQLCVAIATDKKIRIALDVDDAQSRYGWNTYGWDLNSTGGNCQVFQKTYESAKQESGWGTQAPNTYEYTAVQFSFKNQAGSTANVKIYQVAHGSCSCSGGGGNPVLPKAEVAGIKANLNGSALAFSGLGKRAVAVEVLNLQGRVVASQVVNAAANVLDLSKLSQGVYLVKASGKDVRFNQMITLQ